MPVTNGKPVHVSPPPIPGRNQGTDNLAATFGYQEDSRGIGHQALDLIAAVGRACVLTSFLLPQLQYCLHVGLLASTYRDFASQAGIVATKARQACSSLRPRRGGARAEVTTNGDGRGWGFSWPLGDATSSQEALGFERSENREPRLLECLRIPERAFPAER